MFGFNSALPGGDVVMRTMLLSPDCLIRLMTLCVLGYVIFKVFFVVFRDIILKLHHKLETQFLEIALPLPNLSLQRLCLSKVLLFISNHVADRLPRNLISYSMLCF